MKNKEYTTYEMTLQMFKAKNISPEGVEFESFETLQETDRFAESIGYRFCHFTERFKAVEVKTEERAG